jgi:hypothetical protein
VSSEVAEPIFVQKYILTNKAHNRVHKCRTKKILYLLGLNKLHEQGLGYLIFFFGLTEIRLSPRKHPSVDGACGFIRFSQRRRLLPLGATKKDRSFLA